MNMAMADAYIAGFKIRYVYDLWRPVTAIREGDTDGNDATAGDPSWNSLQNTPSVSDYPSTQSTFSGAAAAALAGVLGHRPGGLLGHERAALRGHQTLVHELLAGGAGERGLPGLRRHPLPHGVRGRARPGAQDRRAGRGALPPAGEEVTTGSPPWRLARGR